MKKEYILDHSAIDTISNAVDGFFAENGADRRKAIEVRLSLEEYLLRLHELMPETRIFLDVRKRFGVFSIEVCYEGGEYDPTSIRNEDYTFSAMLLQRMDIMPSWDYRRGINRLRFRFSAANRYNSLLATLAAMLFSALLGILGGFVPEIIRTELDTDLLIPVSQSFLGLLNTFAGVMVFFIILSGIIGIGDTGSLGKIGRTVFSGFLLGVLMSSILTMICAALAFNPQTAQPAAGSSQIRSILKLFFDILPADPVTPFQKGNILQIIVIAIIVGIVLLGLEKPRQRIGVLINDVTVLLQNVIAMICKLTPAFVFVSFLHLIWSGSAGKILQLWKPLLVIIVSNSLFAIVLLLRASCRLKVSPGVILRKVMPAAVIAFGAGSCMAAYSNATRDCREKLGIDQGLIDFAFPVGIVLYMPPIASVFSVLIIFIASVYGVGVNIGWYMIGAITSTLLAYAIPPVPGACLTCYGILFAQMGLPVEGLGLAAAFDVLMRSISAGFIILQIMLSLLSDAKKLDMIRIPDH